MSLSQLKIKSQVKNRSLVEARRQDIARAAYDVFTKKGFRTSTVEEVAKALGQDKRSLYQYIGKKEDLLFLVFCHFLPMFRDRILEKMEEGSGPISRLKKAVEENIKITIEYQDFVLLIIRELRYLKKNMISEVLRLSREQFLIYENILKEGKEVGVFRIENAKVAATCVVALIHNLALSRWELSKMPTAMVEKETFSFIMNIIVNQSGRKWKDENG